MTTTLAAVDDWRTRAACRDSGEAAMLLFFPPSYEADSPQVQAAKRICRHCPVSGQCLEWQMGHERKFGDIARHGIFGGLTPRERKALELARTARRGGR